MSQVGFVHFYAIFALLSDIRRLRLFTYVPKSTQPWHNAQVTVIRCRETQNTYLACANIPGQ
jgi:hypothetical protein